MAIKLYNNPRVRDKNGNVVQVSTNAQQVLTNISDMIRKVKDEADNLSEWCAREIVVDAKQNLKESGYNVSKYLDNIDWNENAKKKYYTVSIKNNSDKYIMYYLEYGTGFVGKDNPHKMAKDVGWNYAINEGAEWYFDASNPDTFSLRHNIQTYDTNKLGEDVGYKGWFYRDKHGRLNITSGLKSVSYLYNAYNKFNAPNGAYDRALARTKIKSIIKVVK